MGTTSSTPLAAALFPKARARVLALFFGHRGGARYLREVVEETGLGVGAVQRELERLVAGGVLLRWLEGRHVFFRADPACPIHAELRAVAAKALGGARPKRRGARRVRAG